MAPIRRFSTAEKGKAPREEPEPLPLKKRFSRPHNAGAGHEVTQLWYERPPPSFPLPLYARAQDGSAQCRAVQGRGGQAEVVRLAGP